MDIENDPKRFVEVFKKLPSDLKEAVYSQEVGENIEAICNRNNIPEHFDYLTEKMSDVYMGEQTYDNFLAELEKRLVGKTGIKQIIFEINKFLIAPYIDSLKKLNEDNAAAAIKKEPQAAAS